MNDGGAAAIFDFSLVSQGLTGFINRGYTRFVDAWGNELSARRLEAPVTDIILSPIDDRVYFAEFVPDLALNITDPGGNDSYYMPAGCADATSAPGSIHIDDQIGAFDNIVLEHSQPNTPLVLDTYRVENGRELLTYTAGMERLTLTGLGSNFNDSGIVHFGETVSFTTPGEFLDLQETGLRIISPQFDYHWEMKAGHFIFDTIEMVELDHRLNANYDGYIDVRAYQDAADIVFDRSTGIQR